MGVPAAVGAPVTATQEALPLRPQQPRAQQVLAMRHEGLWEALWDPVSPPCLGHDIQPTALPHGVWKILPLRAGLYG